MGGVLSVVHGVNCRRATSTCKRIPIIISVLDNWLRSSDRTCDTWELFQSYFIRVPSCSVVVYFRARLQKQILCRLFLGEWILGNNFKVISFGWEERER